MVITEDERETLEFIRESLQIESKRRILTEWELNFIRDQLERFDQYGLDTRYSPKQWAIVTRIEESLQTGQSSRGRR